MSDLYIFESLLLVCQKLLVDDILCSKQPIIHVIAIEDISESQYCNNCKHKIAEIFQFNGDYCLECWQDYTHPNIS